MDANEIARMTGAGNYGKRFTISEVTFNGDTGHFFYRNKDAQKGENGKYPKEDLGQALDVVFLKIRRKLSVFKKGGNGMTTSEHNHKGDLVVLYGPNFQDRGSAAQMRDKYQELRTQQMVYAFLPAKKEVVRVVIKGASLGSEYKHPADVKKFYDYLQTFDKDNHMHEFWTKLVPITEEGPKGEYYALKFERGAKLTDEQQEKVNDQIVEIHNAIEENDKAFRERANIKGEDLPREDLEDEDDVIQTEDPLESEFNTPRSLEISYPDDEINPEDIPF